MFELIELAVCVLAEEPTVVRTNGRASVKERDRKATKKNELSVVGKIHRGTNGLTAQRTNGQKDG